MIEYEYSWLHKAEVETFDDLEEAFHRACYDAACERAWPIEIRQDGVVVYDTDIILKHAFTVADAIDRFEDTPPLPPTISSSTSVHNAL